MIWRSKTKMDIFLGKLTQHAMNYAIRSGIAITSSYAINQCARLLKTVDDSAEYQELQTLQERLDSKIRIISPAIDMIELISARGNTTLESAVSLVKGLRLAIQTLAQRLSKAASAEETARREGRRAKTHDGHLRELRAIAADIRRLLQRIEDAVPLINLAITTSGASLSTTLPATVSPSRLLQASTFLTAGDTQYSVSPNESVQIGPTFTLSVYMLFSGHAHRARLARETVRDSTWKEVIHKARVKLLRVPLAGYIRDWKDSSTSPHLQYGDDGNADGNGPVMAAQGQINEFAYQLEIIEDLDDDRVHSFEEDDVKPGPYKDVLLAGIRELVPIHQVSKIFYADTGKILNIGSDGESNSPILLLKRDIHALPPRSMMDQPEAEPTWNDEQHEDKEETESTGTADDDWDPSHQLHRENSVVPESPQKASVVKAERNWRFPPDLDQEWLAFEVYTEAADEDSDEEPEASADSAYASHGASPTLQNHATDSELISDMAQLHLKSPSPSTTSSPSAHLRNSVATSSHRTSIAAATPTPSPFGPIRSSLSLLEMLIRLTALQQFQQASHLSIPDELLTFFLEESSTTGAGGDSDERRRKRYEARQKVGFDPYDESPVKRRGEEYQYGRGGGERWDRDREGYDGGWGGTPMRSREGTPYRDRGGTPYSNRNDEWGDGPYHDSPGRSRRGGTPEQWLPESRNSPAPFSPQSPSPLKTKAARPVDRVQQARTVRNSPLAKGMTRSGTDSSLGTSPAAP